MSPRTSTHRSAVAGVRRGIALLTAISALLLVSLATLGLFHLSIGEARRTRADAFTVQAAAAADAGALSLMRDWNQASWDSMPVGAPLPVQNHSLATARATVRGTRISPLVWHVVSVGESGDSAGETLARRSVNALLRLALPDLPVNAALTARDSVQLHGTARVVGSDTVAGALAQGCAAGSAGAAVASPDTTRTCDGSCATHSGTRAIGMPALLPDSLAANPLSYASFGAESWATLTSHAGVVVGAGSVVTPLPHLTSGSCDRSVTANWGDPSGGGPCAGYAPVVWAQGDLEMRGGAGQGLLLVDGDFTLSQGAEFVGVVIARDDLLSAAGGGRIAGLAMAADARTGPGDHTTLGDGVHIQLARCAVDAALRRSARLVPVVRRWWAAVR